MSGKLPPTGPRALVGTQIPQSSSSSSHPQPPPPSIPKGPRAASAALVTPPNKPIPTGPRSLQTGTTSLPPPRLPAKHLANGSGALQTNRHPISIKGNHFDKSPAPPARPSPLNQTWQSQTQTQINGRRESTPTTNGASSSSTTAQNTIPSGPSPSAKPLSGPNSEPSASLPPVSTSITSGSSRAAISIAIPSAAAARSRDKLPKPVPSPFTRGDSAPVQPESAPPPTPPPPPYEPPPPPPPSQPPPPMPPSDVGSASPPPPPPEPSNAPPPPPPPPASFPLPPPPPPSSTPPPPPPQSRSQLPQPPPPPSSSLNPLPPPEKPSLSRSPLLPPLPSSQPARPHTPTTHSPAPPAQSSSSASTSKPPTPHQLYSLPPLPEWPPPRSEYSSLRSFKVLYDPIIDTFAAAAASSSSGSNNLHQGNHRQVKNPEYYRALIEHVRNHAASASVVQERIRGKGKGKEILMRFEGEVVGSGTAVSVPTGVDGRLRDSKGEASSSVGTEDKVSSSSSYSGIVEEEVTLQDPRRHPDFRKLNSYRPFRGEFVEVHHEYDPPHSVQSPPTAVLLVNVPPLTSASTLRAHLRQYGAVNGFEWKMDPRNGAALGVAMAKFASPEEAAKCAKGENGRRAAFGIGMASNAGTGDDDADRIRAVLDGEGKIMLAVLKELEERRRRKEKGLPALLTQNQSQSSTGTGTANGHAASDHVQTPSSAHPGGSWSKPPPLLNGGGGSGGAATPTVSIPTVPIPRPVHPSLPPKPTARPNAPSPLPPVPVVPGHGIAGLPPNPVKAAASTAPPDSLVRARQLNAVPMAASSSTPYKQDGGATPRRQGMSSMYRPSHRPVLGKGHLSRSPSPPYYRSREGDREWDTYKPMERSWDRSRGRGRDRRDRSWSRSRSRSRSRSWSRSPSPSRDRSRGRDRDRGRDRHWSRSRSRSRSRERSWERDRSPEYRYRKKERDRERDEQEKAAGKEKHEKIIDELVKNGKEHVRLPLVGSSVQEEDVKTFFQDFKVDKIFKDHSGWYITFLTADAARRAERVLSNSNSRQLAYQSVTLAVHSVPSPREAAPQKKVWKGDDMVEEAQQIIVRELRASLESDIKGVAAAEMLALIIKEKESIMRVSSGTAGFGEKRGLKGLSFKKQPKKVVVEEVRVEEEDPEKVDAKMEEEEEVVERPKKKRKKEAKRSRRVVEDELESEDEEPTDSLQVSDVVRKRAVSEEREDEQEEPVRKKQKVEGVETKSKKKTKKKGLKKGVDAVVEEVYPDGTDYDAPTVAHVPLTPGSDLTPSPSPAPEVKRKPPRVVTPPPTPPPDPLSQGLCDDDEDIYYLKLALEGYEPPEIEEPEVVEEPSSTESPAFRKHVTGSARTEGYYKITHAEKAAYVAQYQARTATTIESTAPVEEPQQPQHVTSSRSNRANARRRAQGLEEINQVQRAVALSKGENVNELTFKFNQLQTRKKHLRFARSPIHDWGLYAMEKISRGEMVIEYVGEVIRAQVAEKREKAYERQGIGSSYLFRIDEDLVVDATKKGNLGRLINHACDPNCTAKIITISGEKKIVIYAKQDIELGDEITYDYHFPFEQDKIPCLCGSIKCRGFLN